MIDITITLHKQQIVNDVAAECNLLGRTMEVSGKDGESSSLIELAGFIKSPDDDETKPIVARSMTEGWDQVKESCQRFIKYGRNIDDNRLEAIVLDLQDKLQISSDEVFSDDPTYWHASGGTLVNHLGVLPTKRGTKYSLHWDLTDAISSGSDSRFQLFVGKDLAWEGFFSDDSKIIDATFEATTNSAVAPVRLVLLAASLDGNLPGYGTADTILTLSHKEFDDFVLELAMDDAFNVGITSSLKSYAHRLIVDTVIAAVLKNQQVDGYTKYLATAKTAKDGLIRALQARSSFMRHTSSWM